MKAYVDIGRADIETIARYAGNEDQWTIVATQEGLMIGWADPHMKLFFAWDHFESDEPERSDPFPKAQLRRAMTPTGENETLPGLDKDIRKWTREADDEA